MKLKLSMMVALLVGVAMADVLPEQMRVYPTPQEVTLSQETFATPTALAVAPLEGFDADALRVLRMKFTVDPEAAFTFSWALDASLPQEGYTLVLSRDGVQVKAATGTGLFYAVKTLTQLLAQDEAQGVSIKDWPVVPFRGTVEGFYGLPWSFESRKSQFRFYGDVKMNAYIYGPKDDPFHGFSNRWREPYPEADAKRIAELVKVAKENKVNFIWAIHPGVHISWKDDSDIKACVAKFEMMYKLGVRSFAVFFDDIGGEGARAEKQVELMNYVNRHFVRAKKDVTPLILCPTQYNQAWAGGNYLDILGQGLDKDIMVMWTGPSVCSDITKKSMEWINNRIGRKAYIWWNWPVSDYVRWNLLLGKAYGLDKENGEMYSGFVSNPMDKPEASKIGLFGVADYAWNPMAYNPDQAWKDGIQRLFPCTADAVQTFANHNSDQGPNGHGYRREESVAIEPAVKRATEALKAGQTPAEEDIEAITEEFKKIQTAGMTLLQQNQNALFMNEVIDWVDLFTRFGTAGGDVHRAIAGEANAEEALEAYLRYCADHEAISKRHAALPFQTRINVATRVMAPYAKLCSEKLYDRLWMETTGKLAPKATAKVYTFITNVDSLKNTQVTREGKYVKAARILEPRELAPGEWFGIALPTGVSVTWVHFVLSNNDAATQGRIQLSRDGGKSWGERATVLRGNGQEGEMEVRHIQPNDGINAVRYINVSDRPVSVTLKQVKVDVPEDATANVMGSMSDGDMMSAYTIAAGATIHIAMAPVPNPDVVKVISTAPVTVTADETGLLITAGDKEAKVYEILY